MSTISSGDTAWLLSSAALVMLMTPALGFFYGGLVRRKNVLATIMHSFFILALIGVQWVIWGYSLAFCPDHGGVVGGLDWLVLKGVGEGPSPYAPTVPHLAFMAFQMMFAVITPALITGGFAERKRFKAFLIFTLLWATLVYDPVAHWVWGGGWLGKLGVLDFAGGVVVHITSGISALVAAWVLGHRKGLGAETAEPHDATMVVLGASLLWFGWFGFNSGSALSSAGLAASAFVVTNTAGAMGALTWVTASWLHKGAPSVLGAATGAIAGLATITPAAGYVDVSASIVIGLAAGFCCYSGIQIAKRLNVDDALDVFGVHGVGGVVGVLLTGVFAELAVNPAGANGLLYGNPGQLAIQAIAVLAVTGYSAVATFVLLKVVDAVSGLRVAEHDEILGLDMTQHGEEAYTL